MQLTFNTQLSERHPVGDTVVLCLSDVNTPGRQSLSCKIVSECLQVPLPSEFFFTSHSIMYIRKDCPVYMLRTQVMGQGLHEGPSEARR